MTRMRVAVVFGGRSGEHDISLLSAESIMANLDASKYEIVPIGITRQGRWIGGPASLKALKEGKNDAAAATAALLQGEREVDLVQLTEAQGGTERLTRQPIDVVFPVLHGPYGEDGTIQGLLELVGVPYVGAGVLASAVGMDKAAMKALWRANGLPVVESALVRRSEWEHRPDAVLDEIEGRFAYPCFIKPANMGSSVGVSKAVSRASLARALREAAAFDARILVERAVNARELECSVLGNESPEASVVGEIVPAHDFYDYRAKYIDEGSQLLIPAEIPQRISEQVQKLALEAFKAIDCSGMARVDFFLDRDSGRVLLNEINTIPGFTRISMYPKLWEASGLPYPDLLDRLVELALERHRDRSRNRVDYVAD